eukprot:3958236-Amphidinium_carterae.1
MGRNLNHPGLLKEVRDAWQQQLQSFTPHSLVGHEPWHWRPQEMEEVEVVVAAQAVQEEILCTVRTLGMEQKHPL